MLIVALLGAGACLGFADKQVWIGIGSEKFNPVGGIDRGGKWDASIDLSWLLDDKEITFFYPFTTTLLELRLNRDPMPLDPSQQSDLFRFI